MSENFAAFILTHGRPDRVFTFNSLRKRNYTGRIILLVDDDDKTLPAYRERYGDQVEVFSKAEIVQHFDEGDNFRDRRAIVYARNACWDVAKRLGLDSFIRLDDDYQAFQYRLGANGEFGYWNMRDMDGLFALMVKYLRATPFASIAMAQGGDYIGGAGAIDCNGTKRKAMNTFVCLTDRRFWFQGRINEDVNTYTEAQRRGVLFLTVMAAKVVQKITQSNAGGMTELYLDSGTYVKSFYSVMYAPSCVRVGVLKDPADSHGNSRIHHQVCWRATAPLILREEWRKAKRKVRK